MATSSKTPTIKEIEKRMDVLTQTVCRCKGAKLMDGVIVSRCVTCGKWFPCFGPKALNGGHFIPRGCRITRWEFANVYPQCRHDNCFKDGAYIEYSRYMMKNHPEDYEKLITLFEQHKKGIAPKLSVVEKQALYNYWLKKGRELEEKTSLKLFPKSWDYVNIK